MKLEQLLKTLFGRERVKLYDIDENQMFVGNINELEEYLKLERRVTPKGKPKKSIKESKVANVVIMSATSNESEYMAIYLDYIEIREDR